MNDRRRALALTLSSLSRLPTLPILTLLGAPLHAPAKPTAPQASTLLRRGEPLVFPRDFGAHPALRTEWWYLTGTLATAGGPELGFQVTFFRSRVDSAAGHPSAFAARQLVFAHAALSDPQAGRLVHDQRIARTGFGLAEAAEGDTRVNLRDWTLARSGPVERSVYTSRIRARDFDFDLRFEQTQPVLLQGEAGFSRKGPRPEQASRYYSHPQLRVSGSLGRGGRSSTVQGRAWLDHEWSESLLDADAVGWDWVGVNLHDGGALTAFRLRRRDGSALWAGGSLRTASGATRSLSPDEVRFSPLRWWTSPATRARYPVVWQVEVAGRALTVRARLDAQELDSRASTGGVYWEGLSDLLDEQGRPLGTGYLEMTGYAGAMKL
ncbi:MAG: carotenoid 1,2-hydratase [Burkholderiales bacterium]|nr:carotenoid 1,2-hydratase [Burkholderiales bacterium]